MRVGDAPSPGRCGPSARGGSRRGCGCRGSGDRSAAGSSSSAVDHPGPSSSAGSTGRTASSTCVDPGRPRPPAAGRRPGRGARCMRAVIVPSALGLGPEVAAGPLGRAPRGVEVAHRGEGQGPARRALPASSSWTMPEVAPVPRRQQGQRGGEVVEAHLVEGHQQRRPPGWGPSTSHGKTVSEQRSLEGRAPIRVVSSATGDRPGPWTAPPVTAAQQRGRQLGVAQGVDDHGQAVVVLEEPEDRVSSPARRNVRLVAGPRSPSTRWTIRPADLGDDVEQAGPAGPAAPRPRRTRRPDPGLRSPPAARRQPGRHQLGQRPAALRRSARAPRRARHGTAWTAGRPARTRSNQ